MRAILTFHSVDRSGSVLSITPHELRSLVRAIRRSRHRIVSLREILDAPDEARQIALTFDDGMRSLHEHALPVLQDEEVPATVFLTSGYVGRNNRWPSLPESAPTMDMMGWSEVEDLHDAGWAIEAHTATHPDLRGLDDDAIREELERGDQAIHAHLGIQPEIFAYPYGYCDERVRSIAAERYRYSLTAQMGLLPRRIADAHRVPRLETYYFRTPAIHARFGTLAFSAYLASRTLLRRLKQAAFSP